MPQKKPLLSICIPTFNRAETLKKTLHSFTSDPYFQQSDLVEIIISDNCSTDHTEVVGKKYAEHFPNKISYHRNACDLAEGNFELVLHKGNGTFRKLQNDSFGIQTGLLECLVKIISSLQEKKPVVFLVNEEPKSDKETLQNFDSLDGFMAAVSYKCTWIGGFGIWAEDLHKLSDFSRAINLHLTQTDVLLRMVAQKKHAVVIQEFMQPCFLSARKRGYNIAEVFGANYLSILKGHVNSGALSQAGYATEKKRVLIEHTLKFVFNKDHDFLNDNLMHHLRDYVGEPYFMQALESAQSASRPQVAQPETTRPAESFAQQWRNANLHNETTCTYPIPLQKVSVGRRTYGAITALHWGHPEEYLKIGSFCSIGGGVEFMLGGNHAMDGLSTFPVKVKYFGHAHEALTKGPIVVGDDVWIGNRATILSGTQIGQGAVVGACAVVSGRVPPYAVVAGNPARIVRYRYTPELIEKMLELNYDKVTDASILAMGERMYETLTDSNVEAFVQELMSSNSDKEKIKNHSDEFNLFKKQYNAPSGPVKIAFIGNSITLHGPATEIGWHNNNGMAARAIDYDYCHSLLDMLEIPSEHALIMNFAEAERENICDAKITRSVQDLLEKNKPQITVIQLGDNVSNDKQLKYFHDNLQFLASIAKKNSAHVVVLSTWWESATKDRIIKEISDSTESTYIYIGDLFNSNENVDRAKTAYNHAGVNNHPREWGMSQIARRIQKHFSACLS
jgi:acetyltransferase-like isoleucine patch superfamily enzyme/glycosyltransferase involved in cell wall biosynthesis